MGRLNDETILTTPGLDFGIDNEADSGRYQADSVRVVAEVLRRLRYVSRQCSMPRTCVAVSTHKADLESATLSITPPASNAIVRSYFMATALTEEHMEQVAGMSADFAVPVHADVLLDALEAHIEEDFRKALLYAAIAVEAFARVQLETMSGDNVVRAGVCHRIISLPQAGGANVRKDPISDLLFEGDSFSRLLHETPLYVLGRSLLVDRPDTYRKALRLYTTRNKIAHLGAPPIDEKHFAATLAGSTEALAAAVDAVEWFGDVGPYVVWDAKFVAVKDRNTM